MIDTKCGNEAEAVQHLEHIGRITKRLYVGKQLETELTGHLTETLRRPDKLAEQRPTETWLRLRIKEAREAVGMIVGYLLG